MLQHHPLVQALSRLGALAALVVYLLVGLGPSLRYGRSIGEFFGESLAATPLQGVVFDKLLVGIGTFLGGLAAIMLFILFGALLGTIAGVILVRYVIPMSRPERQNHQAKAEE